ncbi:hypothetical protein D3C79_922360 [compost metagenome]
MQCQRVAVFILHCLLQRLISGKNAGNRIKLFLQASRQNRQPHYLNQADVLLLDMVHLPVRVENPFRILLAGPVVAQHQIHLEAAVLCAAHDRCNRIMRCLYSVYITERQHISFRITVTLPGLIQRISAFQ